MSDDLKLLPCPFCGGDADIADQDCYRCAVVCTGCYTKMGYHTDGDGTPSHEFDTPADAISAWNRRALSPNPVAASPAPDPSDKVREAAMVPEIAALIKASRRITEADWVYTSMTDDLCNAMLALDAIAGGDA